MVDGVLFFVVSELFGVLVFDVVIDFSLLEGFDLLLVLCVDCGVGLVLGIIGIFSM